MLFQNRIGIGIVVPRYFAEQIVGQIVVNKFIGFRFHECAVNIVFVRLIILRNRTRRRGRNPRHIQVAELARIIPEPCFSVDLPVPGKNTFIVAFEQLRLRDGPRSLCRHHHKHIVGNIGFRNQMIRIICHLRNVSPAEFLFDSAGDFRGFSPHEIAGGLQGGKLFAACFTPAVLPGVLRHHAEYHARQMFGRTPFLAGNTA